MKDCLAEDFREMSVQNGVLVTGRDWEKKKQTRLSNSLSVFLSVPVIGNQATNILFGVSFFCFCFLPVVSFVPLPLLFFLSCLRVLLSRVSRPKRVGKNVPKSWEDRQKLRRSSAVSYSTVFTSLLGQSVSLPTCLPTGLSPSFFFLLSTSPLASSSSSLPSLFPSGFSPILLLSSKEDVHGLSSSS